jgi:release factor glutamine methyltransferase
MTGFAALAKLEKSGLSRSDALDIVAHAAELPYKYIAENLGRINLAEKSFEKICECVANHEPAAYITGRREFYGLEFDICEGVFIPRIESEVLSELAIKELAIKERPKRILDLCTGCGAVLISVLYNLPDAEGCGADFSYTALDMAKRNADKFGLSERAEFYKADILKERLSYGEFDLITVNPPYLSESEYALSEPSVHYEPKSSLVAEEEGYYFYIYLLNELRNFNNMLLLAETGAAQTERVAELAEGLGYSVTIYNDLAGRNRVIRVYKN